jgi:hypothetical protein
MSLTYLRNNIILTAGLGGLAIYYGRSLIGYFYKNEVDIKDAKNGDIHVTGYLFQVRDGRLSVNGIPRAGEYRFANGSLMKLDNNGELTRVFGTELESQLTDGIPEVYTKKVEESWSDWLFSSLERLQRNVEIGLIGFSVGVIALALALIYIRK